MIGPRNKLSSEKISIAGVDSDGHHPGESSMELFGHICTTSDD